LRYAAYVRISSEDQIGNFSIDAQKRAIRKWVADQDGVLTHTYVDEGESGRDTDRPAFQSMRRDARKGRFDALVMHKFDRLARNRANALAIKSLLRHDYGVKVFSVTEPSEDSDGPIGALIEGIMESVAEWYSQNLATEVAKGKLERARQGLHNNQAPFGYCKDENGVLVAHPEQAPGVQLAYEKYATGDYSDVKIAWLLNEHGYRSTTGRLFSKDTIRDLLQNRTYLGYVKYQAHQRNSNGSRSYKAEAQWFDGQHDAILDEDLFKRCQQVRASRAYRKGAKSRQLFPYPLSGILFCGRCGNKLRAQSDYSIRRYRCRAYELGHECDQKSIRADEAEGQILAVLMSLKLPADWRSKVTQAIAELLGDQKLDKRMAEIRETIERMDFRWDHGFITDRNEYLEQRVALQQELERLTPIPDDDLELAVDLLSNFEEHWKEAEDNPDEQERLFRLMLVRAWVVDGQVTEISLRPNIHIVLGLDQKGPTLIEVDPLSYQNGSDGLGLRAGCVPGSFVWSPRNAVYHLVIRQIVHQIEGVQE
jgi:site-specific DNA recombinase